MPAASRCRFTELLCIVQLANNCCFFLVGEYQWEPEQESQDPAFYVQEVSGMTDLEQLAVGSIVACWFQAKNKE